MPYCYKCPQCGDKFVMDTRLENYTCHICHDILIRDFKAESVAIQTSNLKQR